MVFSTCYYDHMKLRIKIYTLYALRNLTQIYTKLLRRYNYTFTQLVHLWQYYTNIHESAACIQVYAPVTDITLSKLHGFT